MKKDKKKEKEREYKDIFIISIFTLIISVISLIYQIEILLYFLPFFLIFPITLICQVFNNITEINSKKEFLIYLIFLFPFVLLFYIGFDIAFNFINQPIEKTVLLFSSILFAGILRCLKLLHFQNEKNEIIEKSYETYKNFSESLTIIIPFFFAIALISPNNNFTYNLPNLQEIIKICIYCLLFGSSSILLEKVIQKIYTFLNKLISYLKEGSFIKTNTNLKDIFNKLSNKINFRYNEDYTLKEFIKYMDIERKLILFIQLMIFGFIVLKVLNLSFFTYEQLNFNSFFDILNLSFFTTFFSQINLQQLLIYLGVLIWLFYSFLSYIQINNHLKLAKNIHFIKKKWFIWNQWTHRDIILKETIKLNNFKKIVFDNPKNEFIIYFLARDKNAGIRWFGFTNIKNNKLKKDEIIEKTCNITKKQIKNNKIIIDIKKSIINQKILQNPSWSKREKEEISTNYKKNKKMKIKKTNPTEIISIRIRSNISNNKIEITGFDITN